MKSDTSMLRNLDPATYHIIFMYFTDEIVRISKGLPEQLT